ESSFPATFALKKGGRVREMIDLLAVEEPKPKPAKVHRRSPEARLRPLDDSAPASKRLLQHGVIPGSCHMKAHGISSPGTYETTHSSGLAEMESNNGMLRGTGRVVEADIDLCGKRDGIGRARRRS